MHALIALTAPIALQAQAPDPDSVTPGVVGFIATAVVAIAVILLLFDMNRRIRRVRYREEVRADIAAEQAAAEGTEAQAAPAEAEASAKPGDEATGGDARR